VNFSTISSVFSLFPIEVYEVVITGSFCVLSRCFFFLSGLVFCLTGELVEGIGQGMCMPIF